MLVPRFFAAARGRMVFLRGGRLVLFFCVCTDFATKKLLLARVDTKFFSVIYFQLLKRNTKCDVLTVSF